MAKKLAQERVLELARSGAEAVLKQLRAEIAAIERTFPELATSRRRSKVVKKATRRGRKMSAEARKAVSQRMKKYWGERKKALARAK